MALASVLWCLQISVASAVVDSLRGSRAQKPTHYLSFNVLGDLTNAWECIINAGIVAGTMKDMTLVIPDFGQLRHNENKFPDVYDVDAFKRGMSRIGVEVVESVPDGVDGENVGEVQGADLNGYAAAWGKIRDKYSGKPMHFHVTHNIGYDTYMPRRLKECEEKYDLCSKVSASLEFTSGLKGFAKRVVDELQGGGKDWLAIHLHDYTPFLCEGNMVGELKRVQWRLRDHNLGDRRMYVIGGLQDLEQVASATGIGVERVLNKNKLLGQDVANLGFQEKAAVDFMVGLEANTYMPKRGSSLDDLMNNMRMLRGRHANIISLPDTNCAKDEARMATRMAREKAAKQAQLSGSSAQ